MTTDQQRRKWRVAWQKRSDHFRWNGLTTHGEPRRRFRIAYNGPKEKRYRLRRQSLEKYQARAKRFIESGLTTRGTKRIYAVNKSKVASPLEKVLHAIRSEIGNVLHVEDVTIGMRELYQ